MNENDFLKKLNTLEVYTEQEKTITFFELGQLFGSSLFNVVIFMATLPLLMFSSQWIVFPLTTFIMMCAIWCFFNDNLWMPDSIKALSLSSSLIKKIVIVAKKMCQKEKWADIPARFWPKLRIINIIVIGFAAFQIGYIESPAKTSFLAIFSLLILSYSSLTEKGWLSCAGYLLFLMAL